jgi:hypothetical protein
MPNGGSVQFPPFDYYYSVQDGTARRVLFLAGATRIKGQRLRELLQTCSPLDAAINSSPVAATPAVRTAEPTA